MCQHCSIVNVMSIFISWSKQTLESARLKLEHRQAVRDSPANLWFEIFFDDFFKMLFDITKHILNLTNGKVSVKGSYHMLIIFLRIFK